MMSLLVFTSLLFSICFLQVISQIVHEDCLSLIVKYNVVKDRSWGSLPYRYIRTWDDRNCDTFFPPDGTPPVPTTEVIRMPEIVKVPEISRKEEERMRCEVMVSTYGIVYNVTFGTMPLRMQRRWYDKKCDVFYEALARWNPGPGKPTLHPTAAPTIENYEKDPSTISVIIAECDGGFGNRLRSLFFFMYLANWKYNGARLMYIWDINDACPGHFLSLYHPLENVTFISRENAAALERSSNVARFRNSRHNIEHFATQFKIPVFYDVVLFQGMKQLRLLENVHKKIYDYVTQNDICNALGVHIRRTDLHDELPERRRMSYESVFYFVDNYATSNITLFLAADNGDTQQIFKKQYGTNQTKVSKLLLYSEIDVEKTNRIIASGKVSKEFRHTDLETAVIEMYVLSYTKTFRLSLFSSYSGWIMWIREKWRRKIPTCLNADNPRII